MLLREDPRHSIGFSQYLGLLTGSLLFYHEHLVPKLHATPPHPVPGASSSFQPAQLLPMGDKLSTKKVGSGVSDNEWGLGVLTLNLLITPGATANDRPTHFT